MSDRVVAALAVALARGASRSSGAGRGGAGPPARARPRDARVVAAPRTCSPRRTCPRAKAILEPLLEADPDDAGVKLAGGILRFFEQRYDDAIPLIESSGVTDPAGYLALAKAAREVTTDDARVRERALRRLPPEGQGRGARALPRGRARAAARGARREASASCRRAGSPSRSSRDVKELAAVSTLTEEEIRTSGTVAVCKFGKLMMLSPKALLKGYDWLDTAAHEYTHLVLTAHVRQRARRSGCRRGSRSGSRTTGAAAASRSRPSRRRS